MEFSIYSNIGKVRDDNEDSYIVKKEPYPLIAVADGMGGHNAGEVASKLAVDSLKNTSFLLNKDSRNILDQMETAIKKTNLSIINKGNQDIEYKNMGTTLSIGIIYDGHLYIGHVGDSRVYLYRNNKCQQLTRDDSLVNKLIEDKQITSKEAFNHPQKHIITQALGTDYDLNVFLKKERLLNGDILLFCTDGLTDMVRDEKIEKVLHDNKDISKISSNLGKTAMENGGSDNITLIIVKIN